MEDDGNQGAARQDARLAELLAAMEASNRGDFSRRVPVRGTNTLEDRLAETFNAGVERLSSLARDVTRVGREVGVEGRLGARVDVSGTEGAWRELGDGVNVLAGLAKMLSEDSDHRLGPKEAEYARTIHASGVDLLSLINDLLDLSKVEAGKLQVEPEDVPLAEVKALIERDFQHVAEQKGLGFGVVLSSSLPRTMRTDSLRLRQVLMNLLSNAFKFTDSGRVELRVALMGRGLLHFESPVLNRAEGVLAFSVVDTGIGIAQDKLQRIFEAFHQAEPGTSRKYGGTGLGLSISRELAHLLGGELHVASELGRGSTFTLYVPDVYVGEESQAEGEAGGQRNFARAGESMVEVSAVELPTFARGDESTRSGPRAPGEVIPYEPFAGSSFLEGERERTTRRRVLVADDNIREAFSLISVLESRGLEVLHAESLGETLRVLGDSPEVDGLLLLLPMMEEGHVVLKKLREDARFVDMPIVVVTAQPSDDERARCLDAGASDCVARPLDTDRVLELLRLERRE
ncbi:ATP-binding protein [Myxococcus eversor]|uniref:ATP-binding protein n=1 Tax=Myxococcus eversor TaxID=2709661 RepID=UPI0013D6FB65|nr:ATP-binding protein [Myxococcus eversor]